MVSEDIKAFVRLMYDICIIKIIMDDDNTHHIIIGHLIISSWVLSSLTVSKMNFKFNQYLYCITCIQWNIFCSIQLCVCHKAKFISFDFIFAMSRPYYVIVRLFITPWFVYVCSLAYLCMMMLHSYLNVLSVIIMQYRLEILSQSKPRSNQGLLSPWPNKPEEDENVLGTSLSLRYRHVPQVNCSDLSSSLDVDSQQASINHPTYYPITWLILDCWLSRVFFKPLQRTCDMYM